MRFKLTRNERTFLVSSCRPAAASMTAYTKRFVIFRRVFGEYCPLLRVARLCMGLFRDVLRRASGIGTDVEQRVFHSLLGIETQKERCLLSK